MRTRTRTTLLINCSVDEAQQIRAAAKREDRTISAYILRAVENRLSIDEELAEKHRELLAHLRKS